MIPPSVPSPLQRLNSRVFLSEPSLQADVTGQERVDGSNYSSVGSPGLVLLFTWMNAQTVHIRKYSDTLRGLFPTSTIVVTTVSKDVYWAGDSTKEGLLTPLMTILRHEKENGNLAKGVLVYLMSNGGGFQLSALQKMLIKSPLNASHQPPVALLMDSTPGNYGLESAINGNTPNNPFLRLFAIPVVALLYGINHFLRWVAGKPPIFTDLRTVVMDPQVLPLSSVSARAEAKAAPRLYIYSNEDQITLARHVERHANEARALGFDVRAEKFENSPHVAHARTDPERYWAAVYDLWVRAVTSRQSVDAKL
ncbi:unnamed protein product [Cyclocybe aegerita]|uniref:DUF829-domain-containing protein n=1 Tax=Cyclocybe aegerita TaxID=1973307 RepID=A0A8S0WHB6_CYCAE|nr:unnamed protein product [Cyclocybe aegerita]